MNSFWTLSLNFIGKTERYKEREREDPICFLTSVTPTTAPTRLLNQKSKTQSGCFMGMAGTCLLELSFVASQNTDQENIETGIELGAETLEQSRGILKKCLNYCAKLLPQIENFDFMKWNLGLFVPIYFGCFAMVPDFFFLFCFLFFF